MTSARRCVVDEDVYYDISDEQSALDFAH